LDKIDRNVPRDPLLRGRCSDLRGHVSQLCNQQIVDTIENPSVPRCCFAVHNAKPFKFILKLFVAVTCVMSFEDSDIVQRKQSLNGLGWLCAFHFKALPKKRSMVRQINAGCYGYLC
jgi:hypothetical protein